MGLFGIGDKKKKNSELKREIIRELESTNSSSPEMNRNINALEEMVSEHVIIGNKEETKKLEELLARVAKVKSAINAGREAAARTAFNEARNTVSEWATSAYADKFQEKATSRSDLDNAVDEKERCVARLNELKAIMTAHPEKKQALAAEWTTLINKVKMLDQNIALYSREQVEDQTVQQLEEAKKRNETIKERRTSNEKRISKTVETLKADKEEQEQYSAAIQDANSVLFGDAPATVGLEGYDTIGSSADVQLEGFDTIGATTNSTSQAQAPASIQQAKKKVDENLAKLEIATEDLKDQLAEKNSEYKRNVEKARQLLAKRKTMSQAEYNTIDYQIDEVKGRILSLAKEMKLYQNELQKCNLQTMVLRQLKTENDLDVVNKYGINLNSCSIEEIANYLDDRGVQRNEELGQLDAMADSVLNPEISTLTSVADSFGDVSELNGSKDKYDEFEKTIAKI